MPHYQFQKFWTFFKEYLINKVELPIFRDLIVQSNVLRQQIVFVIIH